MSKLIKNKYYYSLIIIYFAATLIIVGLDIGNNYLLTLLVSKLEILIPTISSISNITPNPSASKLILSLSWIMIIPFYLSRLIVVKWDDIKWEAASNFCNDKIGVKNMYYINLIFIITLIIFMYAEIYLPTTKGYTAHRRIVYDLLCNYTTFVSIYGICIILVFSHLMLLITVITYGIVNNKF